jgi:hypothetical protein
MPQPATLRKNLEIWKPALPARCICPTLRWSSVPGKLSVDFPASIPDFGAALTLSSGKGINAEWFEITKLATFVRIGLERSNLCFLKQSSPVRYSTMKMNHWGGNRAQQPLSYLVPNLLAVRTPSSPGIASPVRSEIPTDGVSLSDMLLSRHSDFEETLGSDCCHKCNVPPCEECHRQTSSRIPTLSFTFGKPPLLYSVISDNAGDESKSSVRYQ